MKNVVFISASPKINKPSVSSRLLEKAMEKFDRSAVHQERIDVRQSYSRHEENDAFEKLSRADAAVISFPLYIFCLPGMLIRFLDDYFHFSQENGPFHESVKLYAIVNCGFPEPDINLEAVRVLESFGRHTGADFRCGVLIGGGPMMLSHQAMNAPFMKRTVQALDDAFAAMAWDVSCEKPLDERYIKIRLHFPRRMYFFMGSRGWYAQAAKNGLTKKDLYRRPYLPAEK